MAEPAAQRRTLSVPAAATELGISPGKITAWIRSGELPGVNLARDPNGRPRYAIMRDDLDAFLRQRAVVPTTPRRGRRLRRKPAEIKKFF